MMNSFQQTKNAAINQDTITFNSQLNLFLSQYEMIYPSLKVDLSERNDAATGHEDSIYQPILSGGNQ
ncbi:sporulation protein YpjB [Peribacillus frigoritolerans]|nr:sporulation protein YpjB [Peribacillus frigoritolerans]